MAMLDRYRKTGGFVQLLTLLETCGPAKQEKFLEIVRQESPIWADELRVKIIDIQRIYSWKDETLAEIIGTIQDLCLAVAIYAADEALKNRLNGMLTHGRKRKIDDLLARNPPTPAEVSTMHMKIIETVRKMANDGYLRLEKIDQTLFIDDDIEEKLAKLTNPESAASIYTIEFAKDGAAESEPTPASSAPGDANAESRVAEIGQLKKKLAEASKEVAVLRHELSVARGKLDQIKKIA